MMIFWSFLELKLMLNLKFEQEVQQAKHAHFAANAEARARNLA